MFRTALALSAAALMAGGAHAAPLSANEQGWLAGAGRRTSNGTFADNNYEVGVSSDIEFRDFFGFALPSSASTTMAAILSIPIYTVTTGQSPGVTVQFTSSTGPTTFGELGAGVGYASQTLFASDSDGTLNLPLDAAALTDIRAGAGGEFFVSGRVVSPFVANADIPDQAAFSFSHGGSVTLVLDSMAVPEPTSFALLGTGLLGFRLVRRQTRTGADAAA